MTAGCQREAFSREDAALSNDASDERLGNVPVERGGRDAGGRKKVEG